MRGGYKQTEVGLIPEEWNAVPLSAVCSMKSGASITSRDLSSAGRIPCYGGNGLRGYSSTSTHDGEYVLIGRQGALCGNVINVRGKFFASEHAIVVTNKYKSNIVWLSYVLNRMNLNQYSESSAQPGLSVSKLTSLQIIAPSDPKEQNAIAEALSDVDALIESLEKLIAKKRVIKIASMQELLTGKGRLSGFDGDWAKLTLGEVCSDISDGTHFTPNYVTTGVPFYSVENVTADDFTNVKYITQSEHNVLVKRCRPERGDILLTRIGSIGDTRLIDWEVDASIYVSLALLKINNKVEAKYLYEFTKSNYFIKDILSRSLLNATPKKINMGDIKNVTIKAPKSRDEQLAIARILSEMQTEIARIEEQLSKSRKLKAGMMQELLTGRTRLV